jgi:BirA family biotin operon repressor/biotin-[acetyl-CoA-carboxylase] ligase
MQFDGDHLGRLLAGKTMGQRIHFLAEVDSTNTYASSLARDGALEGEVVIADRQLRGKGRIGRTWQSPAGSNLYISIILRPPIRPAVSPQITLAAGVATAEALSDYCGREVTLKWPNDVRIRGLKVCGILTEMRLRAAEVDFVVVGIGININMRKVEFDEAFREVSTSLREELGREVSRVDVTVRLLDCFDAWYRVFLAEGFPPVREKWMDYAGILGREIQVQSGEQMQKGKALGIDEEGALLLLGDDGHTKRILSGDVLLTEGL